MLCPWLLAPWNDIARYQDPKEGVFSKHSANPSSKGLHIYGIIKYIYLGFVSSSWHRVPKMLRIS